MGEIVIGQLAHVGALLGAFPGVALLKWIAGHPLQFVEVVFGLGFVIFVHELGHFLVAKACGVKCEKFYLGFDVAGMKLASFKWGETEYGIGALPLGGYVKMLGQDDNPGAAAAEHERARAHGDLPSEPTSGPHAPWDPRSYQAQSVPERMAIISAGVIMNVIFAVLLAALAWRLGVKVVPAATSAVRPGGAAWRAGLQTGDAIVAIGGKPVTAFDEIRKRITLGDLSRGVEVTVRRDADGAERTVTLQPDTDIGVPSIGISGPMSLTIAPQADKLLTGAAAAARPALASGDRVTAIDGEAVTTHARLLTRLAAAADRPVTLTVERRGAGGGTERIEVTLDPQPRADLGVTMVPGGVKAVQDGSPAAAAGIRAGDRIVSIDGLPPGDPFSLDDRLRGRAGTPVSVVVERAGVEETLSVVPRAVTWVDESTMFATPLAVSSLGIALPVEATVAAVRPDGPAARAGLAPGERVVRCRFVEPGSDDGDDGVALSDAEPNWPVAMTVLERMPRGTKVVLRVEGDGPGRDVELEPEPVPDAWLPLRGLAFEQETRQEKAASIGVALSRGFATALEDLSMVYRFLEKLWSRQISARLLGGPLSIAEQAGRSAEEGPSALLLFLTMLSANLAVVNFLPIPVLDGGHMVFLTWELLTGKPPSERVVIGLSYLGLALILTLMLWVFGLDLGLVPRFAPAK